MPIITSRSCLLLLLVHSSAVETLLVGNVRPPLRARARLRLQEPKAGFEELIPSRFDDLPKMADTALAGVGLAGTIALLGGVESATGVPLFTPPMMASGIIFFSAARPPDPRGFISGTICSATLSAALLWFLGQYLPPTTADGLSAGVLLVWYKTTGVLFPPAAVLAGALTAASAKAAQDGLAGGLGTIGAGASFLVFPWLSGHAALWVSALGLSKVRGAARVRVTAGELQSLGGLDDDALREVFVRFDTDGSAQIDADELKVALRQVLGDDLSLDDCRALVGSADRNGNGTVDFEEFAMICRGEVL